MIISYYSYYISFPLNIHHSVGYWAVEVRVFKLDSIHSALYRVHGFVPDGRVIQSFVLECRPASLEECLNITFG